MWGSGWRSSSIRPPTLSHVVCAELPLDAQIIYIGVHSVGMTGTIARVTQWCNPFELLGLNAKDSYKAFEEWLEQRMDTEEYVRPLFGRELLCDCRDAELCHGRALQENASRQWLGLALATAMGQTEHLPTQHTHTQPTAIPRQQHRHYHRLATWPFQHPRVARHRYQPVRAGPSARRSIGSRSSMPSAATGAAFSWTNFQDGHPYLHVSQLRLANRPSSGHRRRRALRCP